MDQLDLFAVIKEPFKFTKTVRLIELFGGIGSQAKALERLGVDFEHYKLVEFDKYAIKSYNAIHNTNFDVTDITKVHGVDLEIVDTDKYDYLLTYSFPCQDLSKAGKQRGMSKDSGTRSGLLWEVERILDELNEDENSSLPHVLLMENVPDVQGSKNIEDFHKWLLKLENLGYSNYVELLNAKDYGVAQNRNRCFMVSILGDYYYKFPQKIKLEKRLKDYLEHEVDEKYYISDEKIKYMKETDFKQSSYDVVVQQNDVCSTLCARDYKDPKCVVVEQPICLNSKVDGKQPSVQDRVYDSEGISTAVTTAFMPYFLDSGGGGYP